MTTSGDLEQERASTLGPRHANTRRGRITEQALTGDEPEDRLRHYKPDGARLVASSYDDTDSIAGLIIAAVGRIRG